MDAKDQGDKKSKGKGKSKVLVYKIFSATTLMIPFDPDNPDKVDATAGMVHTEDGMVLPVKDCLEQLINTSIGFGIEYDEMTGMGTQVQAGHTESTVVDIMVKEEDDPFVKEVLDVSNINPVQVSRTIN